MRDANDGLVGDVAWERSAHGGNGYITKIVGSASGRRIAAQGDVCPPLIRDVDGLEWRPMVVPGRCPADLIGFDGTVDGGYDVEFAGRSDTIAYVAIKDRVLRYDGAALTDTAIVGLPIGANHGDARSFAGKGHADPTNAETYYVFMGPHGLRATFDGGATVVDPAWCPRPSHPHPGAADGERRLQRYGLVRVDPSSPLLAGRHRRVPSRPAARACG